MSKTIDLTDRLHLTIVKTGDKSDKGNHRYRESGAMAGESSFYECKNCGREVGIKHGLPYRLFRKLHSIEEDLEESLIDSQGVNPKFLNLSIKSEESKNA